MLVVSREPLNRGGRPLVARVAAEERHRGLPSAVELAPGEAGLARPAVVLCHELATLRRDELDREPLGALPLARLAAVERALAYALDL